MSDESRISELIERSSLGSAGARSLRDRTPDDVAQRILDRAAEHDRATPPVTTPAPPPPEDHLPLPSRTVLQPGSVRAQPRLQLTTALDETSIPDDWSGHAVQWRALGPVEAVVGGRLVDLGPPRQRALFALLLSRVDRLVAVDTLIEQLWSGNPPAAAMASLRTYVSNLRRVLEPRWAPRTPATMLCTRAPGYLLDSRGVYIDVHWFAAHVAAGRDALGQAAPERAVGEFDAALALWRGPAYADARDSRWAAMEVARLEELRLGAVEARCEAQLMLGDHHGAIAGLEVHVRSHPLREHGCGLLALALYRAGRQADALALLRSTRYQLVAELGIDPSQALAGLERDILAQALALDWHPPAPTRAACMAGTAPPAPPASALDPVPIARISPALLALTSTAAITVVQLLPTATWERDTSAVGRLWRRVHTAWAEMVEAKLETSRAEVLEARRAGNEQSEQALVGEWQDWLLRLVVEYPQLVDDLRRVTNELGAALADADPDRAPRSSSRSRRSGTADVSNCAIS